MNALMNFEDRVVRSALWAAAGDALGWISELTDSRGLTRRTRGKTLSKTIKWKRRIGGMSGPDITFPAGSYSDDTQLRLAVSRSIRGDGRFDVEAFAKVELTVWPAFALGAGRGSKAAASNLQKRDVNWFSNFFSSARGPSYVQAGGNGAAMRIQPHVWRHAGRRSEYLRDVVRDAIVTHGHVYGICGAVFHADCVASALTSMRSPSFDDWRRFARGFAEVEKVITADVQLRRFWLGAWEAASGKSLSVALGEATDEMMGDIDRLKSVPLEMDVSFSRAVDELDGRGRRQGTGTNTALAAAYAAWLLEAEPVEKALSVIAKEIGSDTDTIATMAGAILGANADSEPAWEIQDREYIVGEARRLAKVSGGELMSSFIYPDLADWNPPSLQTDVLGRIEDRVGISGLGRGELVEEAGSSGTFGWSWVRLDFGQTVLCKHKKLGLPELAKTQYLSVSMAHSGLVTSQSELLGVGGGVSKFDGRRLRQEVVSSPNIASYESMSLDELTDVVISSGFDDGVVGKAFNACLRSSSPLDRCVAFAAIVSKALQARKRASSKNEGGS